VVQNAHLKEEQETLIDLRNINKQEQAKEFNNLFEKIR